MDLATARFLLSGAGRRLAGQIAAADPRTPAEQLALATRMRSRHPPDGVAAAMAQYDLRRRAVEKLGDDAAAMMLTTDGLEQATHRTVATHRAARIAAAEPTRVVDLTCGIGADLVAIARAGCRIVGVDRDPATAVLAAANLASLGLPGEVVVGDAETYPLEPSDVCFLDPARRDGSGRLFDVERFSPSWPFVERVLERDAVAKLAPGLPHARVAEGVEAEWVSLDGRLREAVLWSGRFATGVARRATVLTSAGGGVALTDSEVPDGACAVSVASVGRYVYEPDDAVVRAHLVEAYARRVSGWLLDPHLAYVSSDSAVADALGHGYEVIEVLPYRAKALRAALHERDIGALTIKKRGVQVTPEALRDRLRLTGSRHSTLILTRTPGAAQALLVEPLR